MGAEDEQQPVPAKPCGIHAQEAGRCHQQGGKPYQVLASIAVHPMGPFHGQNRINKEIVNLILHVRCQFICHALYGIDFLFVFTGKILISKIIGSQKSAFILFEVIAEKLLCMR